MFSLKYRGKIVRHFLYGSIAGADFQVSEAGRQRVIKEKRKNVHAFIVSDQRPLMYRKRPQFWQHISGEAARDITYNPYKYESFVMRDTEAPIFHTDKTVLLDNRRVFIRAGGLRND